MPRIILDTDVFSYLFRKDTRASPYRPFTANVNTSVSFATVAELYFGAYKANWGARMIAELQRDLKKYVILHSNYEICRIYGKIRFNGKKQPINDSDYWIAACALHYNAILLTNNWEHFKNIEGLKVISPGHSR